MYIVVSGWLQMDLNDGDDDPSRGDENRRNSHKLRVLVDTGIA